MSIRCKHKHRGNTYGTGREKGDQRPLHSHILINNHTLKLLQPGHFTNEEQVFSPPKKVVKHLIQLLDGLNSISINPFKNNYKHIRDLMAGHPLQSTSQEVDPLHPLTEDSRSPTQPAPATTTGLSWASLISSSKSHATKIQIRNELLPCPTELAQGH